MITDIQIVYSAVWSFILAVIFLYVYIKKGGIGLWREDINKPIKRRVLTAGGLPVLIVLLITYTYISVFLKISSLLFFGLIATTVIAMVIGYLDEVYDIKVWKKVPLMLLPPLPLVIISLLNPPWSHTTVLFINFGTLYWILVLPVVYMGFSNGANIIAGYDGLEGGVYILILALYTTIGFITQNLLVLLISIPLLSTVLAFEIFNLPPSKVLLGNVGSFAIGGLLGIIPLIGKFEIVLPIIFLPHIVEFLFKIKYRGKTSVFGEVDENGIIHNKYGIKSIIHWIISWGNMTEKKVTEAMLFIEGILCIVAFFIWFFVSPIFS